MSTPSKGAALNPWPYTSLLFSGQPQPTRPIYDIPPVIVASQRRPNLRAVALRLLDRPPRVISDSGCALADATPADCETRDAA
jgi:hypothetical protein